MLFVKISGAICIILAGFCGGKYMSQNLKLRCEWLENIVKVAMNLKEQIVCFRYEIDIIYKNLIDGGFSKELVLALKNTQSNNEYLKEFDFLNQRDKKLAFELFNGIGMRDVKSEEENILVYIKLIEEQLKSAKDDYLKKAKLYNNVGLFLGIGLAIFLI